MGGANKGAGDSNGWEAQKKKKKENPPENCQQLHIPLFAHAHTHTHTHTRQYTHSLIRDFVQDGTGRKADTPPPPHTHRKINYEKGCIARAFLFILVTLLNPKALGPPPLGRAKFFLYTCQQYFGTGRKKCVYIPRRCDLASSFMCIIIHYSSVLGGVSHLDIGLKGFLSLSG